MTIRRLALHDFYLRDDESVAMVGTTVVRLPELSTWIVMSATEWISVDSLARGLVERFGPPPPGTSSRQVAVSAVAELAKLGIVETRP